MTRSYHPGDREVEHPLYEGLGSDSDVINEFKRAAQENQKGGKVQNHNNTVWIKTPEETQRERAHAGSAAWVDAASYLAEFAAGSGSEGERKIVQVTNSPDYVRSKAHDNAAQVRD